MLISCVILSNSTDPSGAAFFSLISWFRCFKYGVAGIINFLGEVALIYGGGVQPHQEPYAGALRLEIKPKLRIFLTWVRLVTDY